MKVSILIPVYNEARALPKLLTRVIEAKLPHGCVKEVVVINDSSKDGSKKFLDSLSGRRGIAVFHLASNRGKGQAIRAGLAVSTGDIVIVQDGDLEYDPHDYGAILTPIIESKADVVYGSRFLGRCEAMKWQNRLANWILTRTANLLYGANITDQGTAYKAFRAELLKSFELQSERFEFCSEVTAKARRHGYRIHEVPITYKARTIGEGKKIRARDGFQALWTLLKFRFSSPSLILIASDVSQTKAVPLG